MSQRNIGAGPRIRQWRTNQVPILRAQRLAKILGVSQGSLSDIENGNSNPSADTIVKFHKKTKINLLWMLTGKEGVIEEGETPTKAPFEINLNPRVKSVLIRYVD